MIDDTQLLDTSAFKEKLEVAIATGPSAVKKLVEEAIKVAYTAGVLRFNALTHELYEVTSETSHEIKLKKTSWNKGYMHHSEDAVLAQTYLKTLNIC